MYRNENLYHFEWHIQALTVSFKTQGWPTWKVYSFTPLTLFAWLHACKGGGLVLCMLYIQCKNETKGCTAKTTVWISYQNRYDFTVYTGHTKNGMKIIPWIIIPKTVWSSYHKIVWFSSINWCDRYSAYSSIIHAWYTFSFFLLLNDINVAKQITRHIKEMHWHKKQ